MTITRKAGVFTEAVSRKEAIDWFRKSVEEGYDQGQYAYGLVLYANGQAPIEQKTEALKWFTLAGEQGDPSAQYMVGRRRR